MLTSRSRFLFVCFLALLSAGTGCSHRSRAASKNPLLLTPILALEALKSASLYYNGPAREPLAKLRPDLLRPEDKTPQAEPARSFAQAAESPKLFRQLDRQYHFDSLLLIGDPTQYRPLMEHLLETADWKLAYLDHQAIVFRRTETPGWGMGSLDALRARVKGFTETERATFLAAVATKLLAARQTPEARQLLTEAESADRQDPEVWSAWAQFKMAQGDWNGALSDADRALELEGESLAALAAKAQCLYAAKRFNEAFEISRRLVALRPNDPAILFYHSKIAHESKRYDEEIASLRTLIALAEKDGQPTAGYRVYLGQAYAKDGQRDPSLEEFNRAIQDPDLPPEQRAFARDCVALIKQKG